MSVMVVCAGPCALCSSTAVSTILWRVCCWRSALAFRLYFPLFLPDLATSQKTFFYLLTLCLIIRYGQDNSYTYCLMIRGRRDSGSSRRASTCTASVNSGGACEAPRHREEGW